MSSKKSSVAKGADKAQQEIYKAQIDMFIEKQGAQKFAEYQIATLFDHKRKDHIPSSQLQELMEVPDPVRILYRRLFEYSDSHHIDKWIHRKDSIEMLVVDEALHWIFGYLAHKYELFDDRRDEFKRYRKRYGIDDDISETSAKKYLAQAGGILNAVQNAILQKKNSDNVLLEEPSLLVGDFYHKYDMGPSVRNLIPASVYAPMFKGFEKRLATIPDIDNLKAFHLGIMLSRSITDEEYGRKCVDTLMDPAISLIDAIRYTLSAKNIDFYYGAQ